MSTSYSVADFRKRGNPAVEQYSCIHLRVSLALVYVARYLFSWVPGDKWFFSETLRSSLTSTTVTSAPYLPRVRLSSHSCIAPHQMATFLLTSTSVLPLTCRLCPTSSFSTLSRFSSLLQPSPLRQISRSPAVRLSSFRSFHASPAAMSGAYFDIEWEGPDLDSSGRPVGGAKREFALLLYPHRSPPSPPFIYCSCLLLILLPSPIRPRRVRALREGGTQDSPELRGALHRPEWIRL